jgi:hypothetical protein
MNRIATLAFVVAMLGAGAPVDGQGKPTCESNECKPTH